MADSPFDRLERELEAASSRQLARAAAAPGSTSARTAARPRRSRRSLGVLSALVAVPALAATAWAASALISSGAPVAYDRGAPVSGAGVGAPVAGSVRMLTTSVADPDGGLPWGLRTFRTTRGLVCAQIGRVYEGELGVLGRDGSFADDGRFHVLRPSIYSHCFPPDGAGNAYLAVHLNNYVPSGAPCDRLACSDLRNVVVAPGSLPKPTPRRLLRSVDFGLLGPRATSIAYRSAARTRTARTLGAGGGYLVVGYPLTPVRFKRAGAQARGVAVFVHASRYRDGYLATMMPASRVVTRVQYGAAARCVVSPTTLIQDGRRTGGCPDPPGFVPIAQATPGAVRAKVTARAVGGREIRISFVARAAVSDRSRAYSYTIHPPQTGRPCCDGATSALTDRNIAAGTTIVKRLPYRERLRPGRYRVLISLRTQSPHPSPGGNLQYPGTTVGRASFVVR
jgi:hypothetical protein